MADREQRTQGFTYVKYKRYYDKERQTIEKRTDNIRRHYAVVE